MRLILDSFTEEDRRLLRPILDPIQLEIKLDVVKPYQIRRILLLLGQNLQAQAAKTSVAKKAEIKK